MSRKHRKTKNLFETDLVRRYTEVMKLVPKTQFTGQQLVNLKQPSLLEQVDSITTYGVVSPVRGSNA